jgi:hypothetical protein
MAANPQLVKEMGVSESNVLLINSIHEQLEYLIENADCSEDRYNTLALVRQAEFELQRLWGFSQDSMYHTWCTRLHNRFREVDYLGAVYRCNDSHETRTINRQELNSGVLVGVGKGFIDFGGVVRIVGNLERVA